MKAAGDTRSPLGRRRRPTAAAVIAVLALVMACVGTGIAAHKLSGTAIKKRSEPGNRLKKNTLTGKEVKEASLGQVPKAADALTLQGRSAADLLAAGKLARFSVSVNFGQAKTLFTAGPLTFTGTCVQNGTDLNGTANQDFSLILISTSQNGAVFDGFDAKRGENPADPTTFLNTNTPENERRLFMGNTVPTGTREYDSGEGSDGGALAADGTAVGFDVSGVGGAINEFGANCTLDGYALVASG
jgi:hypothetical protein